MNILSKRAMVTALTIAAVLTVAAAAQLTDASADALPNTGKPVVYCFIFENLNKYPDFSVYAYYQMPSNSDKMNAVKPGCNSVESYDQRGAGHETIQPTFYAIRTSYLNPGELPLSQRSNPHFLVAIGPTLNPIETVKEGDPRVKITDTLKITKLDDQAFEYVYVGQSSSSGSDGGRLQSLFNRFWYGLVPVGALVIIGLTLVRRRRHG